MSAHTKPYCSAGRNLGCLSVFHLENILSPNFKVVDLFRPPRFEVEDLFREVKGLLQIEFIPRLVLTVTDASRIQQ
jgi:hypothetical protein